MKKLTILLLCVVLAAAFTACTENDKPKTGAVYDGEKYSAVVENDTLTLDLQSNITTGFEWIITEGPEKMEVLSEEYISEETDEPVCGAPGTTRYVIKALEEGEGTMKLCYCRDGEDGEVDNYYLLTVKIGKNNAITELGFVEAE